MPADLRTMVVVPTLLTTQAEIEEQIERLEVHYLASQDGDLRFALLSDWTDSATETAPGDDELAGRGGSRDRALERSSRPGAGRRNDFFCSIAGAAGMRRRESGWDGSANAESCTS